MGSRAAWAPDCSERVMSRQSAGIAPKPRLKAVQNISKRPGLPIRNIMATKVRASDVRVREDTPSANTTPAMLRFAQSYLADGDSAAMRVRYGRVAAFLFLLAGFYGLIVAPAVGGEYLAEQLVVVSAAFLSVPATLLVPWARVPNWATIVPALWGGVLLTIGGALAGALFYYSCMYAALFAYTGLTQRPGITGRVGVLALIGVGVAAIWGRQDADLIQVIVTVLVSVCVGELFSLSAAWHRHTRSELVLLQMAMTQLVAAESEQEAASIIAEVGRSLLDADEVITVLAVRPGSTLFVGRGGAGDTDFTQARTDVATDDSGTARCIREGRPVFVADAPNDGSLRQELVVKNNVKSAVFIPLPGEGGWMGSLTVWWTSPRTQLDTFAGEALDLLMTQAGQVLERLREVEWLDEAATTDPLTGIGNRRSFDDHLERLPVGGSVIVLDLDFFKQVNDTHGHLAGDDILCKFASLISMCVREGDTVARLGGDEFALFLPTDDSATASAAVLERLRDHWTTPLGVTFSAGVAQRLPAETSNETLVRADTALYENKHGEHSERRRRRSVASA